MTEIIIYRERLTGRKIKMRGTVRIGRNADYWEFDTSSGVTFGIRHVYPGEQRIYLVKGESGCYYPQPYVGAFLRVINAPAEND